MTFNIPLSTCLMVQLDEHELRGLAARDSRSVPTQLADAAGKVASRILDQVCPASGATIRVELAYHSPEGCAETAVTITPAEASDLLVARALREGDDGDRPRRGALSFL